MHSHYDWGAIIFITGRGTICLWGRGQNFFGYSKGRPVFHMKRETKIFSHRQRGGAEKIDDWPSQTDSPFHPGKKDDTLRGLSFLPREGASQFWSIPNSGPPSLPGENSGPPFGYRKNSAPPPME